MRVQCRVFNKFLIYSHLDNYHYLAPRENVLKEKYGERLVTRFKNVKTSLIHKFKDRKTKILRLTVTCMQRDKENMSPNLVYDTPENLYFCYIRDGDKSSYWTECTCFVHLLGIVVTHKKTDTSATASIRSVREGQKCKTLRIHNYYTGTRNS